MVCKSDVNKVYGIGDIVQLTPDHSFCGVRIEEGQNPQIMRPVHIPAIPVSRFRAGKVSRSIVRQGM